MTLEAQTKIIDELIAENPDATIKDYSEVSKEINRISVATFRIQQFNEKNKLIFVDNRCVDVHRMKFIFLRGV
jgi:hypothetical protein